MKDLTRNKKEKRCSVTYEKRRKRLVNIAEKNVSIVEKLD